MGKHLRNTGNVTFYLRKDFRPSFERFVKLVNKDEDMMELRFKEGDNLVSIAICKFINDYLDEKDTDLNNSDDSNNLDN